MASLCHPPWEISRWNIGPGVSGRSVRHFGLDEVLKSHGRFYSAGRTPGAPGVQKR